MRIIISIFILCFWILPVADFVQAQTDFGYLEEKEPLFFVDWAAFREDTGERYRLEIYYKIMIKALAFVKDGDRFRASYEIQAFVSNKVNKQVTGTSMEEVYFVGAYRETRSPSDFLINQLHLSLYSGRYKLRIKLIDLNSASVFELEKDFKIPSRREKKVLFSDIEFVRYLADSSGVNKFNKRGNMVIPSVSRTYGDIDPTLIFYYEIYGGSEVAPPYLRRYELKHQTQAFTYQETTTVLLGTEVFSVFDSLSLEEFPSGDYFFKISLLQKDREKAKIETQLRVDWSFLNMLKNEYNKAIEQLRYVASSDEMKELKETPEEERLQKWVEFWKSKDPTPNTPENELKDEYLRRLKYVNQNLALPTKEGWETDMGIIYMIYGHPDEVERHPFDREARAFQRWYYYNQKGGDRVFLFIDRGGGEYELQPPYDGIIRRY